MPRHSAVNQRVSHQLQGTCGAIAAAVLRDFVRADGGAA
jgi:hypothetical protein